MAASSSPLTYSSLCATVTTFLTVAVHTLLYNRACYPASSFLLARAYDHPVRQSRHPGVCKWIEDAIEAVHNELLAGTLSRVALVICDTSTLAPLERFVFDLARLLRIPPAEAETLLVRPDGDENSNVSIEGENVDISESLRGVLAKMATLNARLGPIPPGCPFTIAIELRDDGNVDPPLGHPQPWIPARPGTQKTRLDYGSKGDQTQKDTGRPLRIYKDLGGARTIPIRSVDVGELLLEMWAEEGIEKASLVKESLAKQAVAKEIIAKQAIAKKVIVKGGNAEAGHAKESHAKESHVKESHAKGGIAKHNDTKQGIPKEGIAKQIMPRKGILKNGIPKHGIAKEDIAQDAKSDGRTTGPP